ncbi:MAG TPA: hypothetical protein PKC87_01355 [Candidatus Absconditabacterales bacterium]|nr:hypothetical protein [Candidatus Absconditabacterales bacterium]
MEIKVKESNLINGKTYKLDKFGNKGVYLGRLEREYGIVVCFNPLGKCRRHTKTSEGWVEFKHFPDYVWIQLD